MTLISVVFLMRVKLRYVCTRTGDLQHQQWVSPSLLFGTWMKVEMGAAPHRLDITRRSCSKLRGYLDPGGNKGFSPSTLGPFDSVDLADFDEFPAFPDLTMPFLGGILVQSWFSFSEAGLQRLPCLRNQ